MRFWILKDSGGFNKSLVERKRKSTRPIGVANRLNQSVGPKINPLKTKEIIQAIESIVFQLCIFKISREFHKGFQGVNRVSLDGPRMWPKAAPISFGPIRRTNRKG